MSSQFIKIPLPLTNHRSKIRVKRRKNILEQGRPIATRQEKIDSDCYFEWQISYDLKEKKSNFDELYQETFNKIKIVDSEKKPTGRCIYELSDLLIEILKKGFIDFQHLSKLLEEVKQEKKFIEDELKVVRNFPKDKVYKFGKYEFLRGIIEHPLLIYEVNGLALKIEIIIKDRQKAAGIQPMLYLCIPSELVEEFLEIKGQVAEIKQTVTYLITKNNFTFVIEALRIFSFLSKRHQQDIINIFQTILDNKENIN